MVHINYYDKTLFKNKPILFNNIIPHDIFNMRIAIMKLNISFGLAL